MLFISTKIEGCIMRIAICCIVKNEHYLQEWIDWHKLIGFDEIIIVDDYSSMEYDLKNCVLISGHPFINISNRQMKVYNWLLENYKSQYDWIAFIDADEYILPKVPVKELLERFSDFGGLGINWVAFGNKEGFETRQQSDLKSYVWRMPENNPYHLHIKTIVNCKFVLNSSGNPHSFIFKSGKYCVDENFNIVVDAFTRVHSSKLIRINHYYTRSKEDYAEKMCKGRADCNEIRYWEHYEGLNRESIIYDNEINEVML